MRKSYFSHVIFQQIGLFSRILVWLNRCYLAAEDLLWIGDYWAGKITDGFHWG